VSPALAVVLANAHVLTMSPAAPQASVLAVVGERIAYVGDDVAAARKAAGPGAEVIDLGGRTVVPGFNDAHAHFGLSLTLGSDQGVDIPAGSQTKKAAWIAAVTKASAAHPDDEWLFVKTQYLPSGISTAADLAFIDRPLFVVSARGGVLNKKGLQRAGFTSEEAPRGFVRGRELAYALDRVEDSLPHRKVVEAARQFLQLLARLGITSIQLIGETPDLFEELRQNGELTARIRFVPLGYRFDTPYYEPSWTSPAPDWVRVDGVKYFHDDGARLSRFELAEVASLAKAARRPVLVHVLSSHALTTLLDGIEQSSIGHPEDARLFRLEHVDEATPEQARRIARLGLMVCSNPSMLPEWHRPSGFPLRTLRDAGVRLCLGSDWVGRHLPPRSLAPLEGIELAVTHGGLGEKERIGAAEALEAYTAGSAAAEGREEKGTLQPGKLADLVVISDDPTAVPPERIGSLEVLLTMVGGRVVHRQAGYAEPVKRAPPSTIGPVPGHRPPTIGPAREPKPQKR
jgi:predicted amidohydrolase YtcJ